VLLIFREHSFNDVEFDLGNVSQFTNLASGTIITVPNWTPSLVTSTFGVNLTGVSVILAGTTSWYDPNRASWLSSISNGVAYNLTASDWQGSLWSTISSIGTTELFEAGREKVRKFLGAADAKEIVFVRGTTEAINLVAQSYGRKNIGAGDEIIVSELEHHANIVPWQLLAEQVGATVRVIPINDRGELILDEYVKLLGDKTKFVSVAHVSNSLGTINPVEQIIALAHARGVPVLVDGAQSTPHLPVNVSALDADFCVFSGHKIFAPTGIGALYGKAPLLEAMPPWQGGGHMIKDVRFEKTIYQHAPEKFEAGTPDIAGVVGLGAAIDYLFKVGIPGIAAYEHALLEYATQALATIPGLRPIGTAATKASVLAFVIPGLPNESIARHLDKNGIAVRAGHHCALPAIRHFGLESSVRPSLAFYNTREEVDALVLALRSLKRS
jgi:SufS family cysteine desulfurase